MPPVPAEPISPWESPAAARGRIAQDSGSAPRLIRLKEVVSRTGLARSTIYAMIAVDLFPRQVELTPSRSAWVESEIDAWIAERVNNRRFRAGVRRTNVRRRRQAAA